MPPNRLPLLSDLMLLAVAVIWGSSYAVVKEALLVYPVLALLTLRFGITFAVLAPALRHLRHASARTLRGVGVAGVLLLAIFVCETFGVALTSAANAAFLISLCVVMTPLVEWLLLARRPARSEWLAVAVSLGGAWLLAGNASFALNPGDALILAAALLRALNVCVTKRVMRGSTLPALTVTAVQAGMVAVGSAGLAVIAPLVWAAAPGASFASFPSFAMPALPALAGHGAFWASIGYLVLACTLFAFFAQNFAIRQSSPTRVALLMGSEPAFGAVFASVWLGEHISLAGWTGGALIVVAALLATVRWPLAGMPATRASVP